MSRLFELFEYYDGAPTVDIGHLTIGPERASPYTLTIEEKDYYSMLTDLVRSVIRARKQGSLRRFLWMKGAERQERLRQVCKHGLFDDKRLSLELEELGEGKFNFNAKWSFY